MAYGIIPGFYTHCLINMVEIGTFVLRSLSDADKIFIFKDLRFKKFLNKQVEILNILPKYMRKIQFWEKYLE